MAEVQMDVKLLAHTQMDDGFMNSINSFEYSAPISAEPAPEGYWKASDGQLVALTAIRTCYSPLRPSEIVEEEGEKYFDTPATDGKSGTESDRLFRHIVASGHTSTLEHLTFTFAIEGVSRSLLAQLTRHRVGFSFSVQSQRYVKLGSTDKSGGFDYVVPQSISEYDGTKSFGIEGEDGKTVTMQEAFDYMMGVMQRWYDFMRENGIPAEDARAVLPNATATNLTMTANLRALLDFYGKRRKGNGAQHEITVLAEKLREAVVAVEPWTDQFFEQS